jgi:predicted NBD/HSP70 family sugar kinase
MIKNIPRIQNQVVPSLLNQINTLNIVRMMWFESPLSRAELSRKTGLSKPTISKIVDGLTDRGLLEYTGENHGSTNGGKRAQLYRFNPNAGYILVCDIQETYVEGVISNCKANFLGHFRINMSDRSDPHRVMQTVLARFKKLLDSHSINKSQLLGVGISMPGVIDFESGLVIDSPGLPKWNGFQVCDPFKESFTSEVFVENENRLMVLAEHWFGAAMDMNDFISISMGESTGTGSAIFIGGNLWRGTNNIAGEIGHMRIRVCGEDGIEHSEKMNSYLAVWSFLNKAQELLKIYPRSELNGILSSGKTLSVEDIFSCADRGDEAAIRAVTELGEWLGLLIGDILLNLDLPLVVINGPYRKGGSLLMNIIQRTINKLYMSQMMMGTKIVYSGISKDIRKIGAVSLVIQQHFSFT